MVGKVVSSTPCGSIFTSSISNDARGHCSIRTQSPKAWPTSTQELVRQDTCAGCWDTCKDQNWEYQGWLLYKCLITIFPFALYFFLVYDKLLDL